jgi:hypothetical protein
MNRMHTFAKIVLVGVGLLTAIRVLPQILTLVYMLPRNQPMEQFGTILGQTAITGGFLAVLFYVFWIKRDWLATRVVGAEPSSESTTSVPWLPAAYRLVCMAAGLHCLYVLTFQMISMLVRRSYAPAASAAPAPADIATWIVLLPAGLYLCWGAPHFVRWQMKKTLEQCRDTLDAA